MGMSFGATSLRGNTDESLDVAVTYGTAFAALRVLGFEFDPNTIDGSIPAVAVMNAAPRIVLAEDYGDELVRDAEARGDYATMQHVIQGDRDVWVRRVASRIVRIAEVALAADPRAEVTFS